LILSHQRRTQMKGTLIALAAVSLFSVVTPASAQDWRDRHDNDWRRHHRPGITLNVDRSYARSSHCSVKVTKIHRNGKTITRRVRSCD
jgi:hypothetical protein